MTATLEPYPDYKPSGVEWLGDVPAHWGVRRARLIFVLEKTHVSDAARTTPRPLTDARSRLRGLRL